MNARQIATVAVTVLFGAFVVSVDVAFLWLVTGHGGGLAAQYLYLVLFYPPVTLCVCVAMALSIGVLIYGES